ncbi:MAG: DUF5011 domain-containing protein [Saprospiraceae bacterium]|nr:DUF5011 domain-containing protein [Candidatus Vicinibacter affinis]
MKNYLASILMVLALFVVSLSSCELEDTTADVSRITYYPTITLKGAQWNTVDQGGSFKDEGVIAKEGDSEIQVKVGGDVVDTQKPGVYTITYTALNKDGYSATEYRYVGVIAPNVKGIDMSGKYKRNAGAQGVSTVTKISDNFYKSDNVGGVASPGPATTVYFYHYDGDKLGVPEQLVAGATFSCINSTVQLNTSYKWVVINSGYGTALRTFIKQ